MERRATNSCLRKNQELRPLLPLKPHWSSFSSMLQTSLSASAWRSEASRHSELSIIVDILAALTSRDSQCRIARRPKASDGRYSYYRLRRGGDCYITAPT